jgi:hypothetical protein
MMRTRAPIFAAGLALTCGACGLISGAGDRDGRSIRAGRTATATLAETDLRMRSRGPYHTWTLRGKRGQRLVIDMTSTSFDTYLYLRDESGMLLGQDDDSGDNNNARIRAILPRNGTYRITATSFGPSGRGDYQLAVSQWSPPDAPRAGRTQPIAPGQTLDGLLEPGDELSGDGPFQDRWTLELQHEQRIRIEMRSSDVDAYLILLDPDGTVLASNDDANGRDAAIHLSAPRGGRYTIIATSFGDRALMGTYRLQVSDAAADPVKPDSREPPDPAPAPGADPKLSPAAQPQGRT